MAAVTVSNPSSTAAGGRCPPARGGGFWPAGISRATPRRHQPRADPPRTQPEVTLPAAPVKLAATTTATTGAARRVWRDLDLGLWVFNPQVGTTIVDLGIAPRRRRGPTGPRSPSSAPGMPAGRRRSWCPPPTAAPASGNDRAHCDRISTTRRPALATAVAARSVLRRLESRPRTVFRLAPRRAAGSTRHRPAERRRGRRRRAGVGHPADGLARRPSRRLPAAVTSEVEAINGAGSGEPGPRPGAGRRHAQRQPGGHRLGAPRVGSDAVMVDLDLLSRLQVNPTSPYAADQVWLGPPLRRCARSAPGSGAACRPRAAGLAAAFSQLQRTGPALADDFLLVATIAALLAAAPARWAPSARPPAQRATELTALEVAGIPRRVLAESLAVESAVLAVTALFGAAPDPGAPRWPFPRCRSSPAPSRSRFTMGCPRRSLAAVSAAVVLVVAPGRRRRRRRPRSGACHPSCCEARPMTQPAELSGRRRRRACAPAWSTSIRARTGPIAALRNVELVVRAGEMLALLGPSGLGQVDPALAAQRPAAPDGGQDPRGRPRHRSHGRARARAPARHRALAAPAPRPAPEPAPVRDRAREPGVRPARSTPARLAASLGSGRARVTRSAWSRSPSGPCTSSRPASSSEWRWRARSPPRPACCWPTNRPPA